MLAELALDETPAFAFQRAVDASLFLGDDDGATRPHTRSFCSERACARLV